MIKHSFHRRRRFLVEKDGSSSAEFALIALLLVTLIFAMVDFAMVLWQYNRMEKAAQLGARYAVTHDLAAPGLETIDGIAAAGGNNLPVPKSAISPNPVECTWSGGNASCNGYGPEDDAAFTAIVDAMKISYPQLRNDQVIVRYSCIEHRAGFCLGFSGNPYGPDIVYSATVIIRGFDFNMLTPGLSKIAAITFGDISATFTGESYGYPTF